MKKWLMLLALNLLFFTTQSLFGQTWNALLNLNPYPSPYASDWEINPGALGSLTVFNNSGSGETIIIKAIVSQEGRGEVFRSTIKPIDLSSAPVTVLSNTKLFSLSDASFSDKEYERILRLTGRLLEGYYTACLTIENLEGIALISDVCSNFTILYPNPPQLIFPQDEDSLLSNTQYPTFQWTPVITPPDYQITYTLKICEVLEGQTPSQALNANYPHYINNQLTISTLTYPIEGLPFEAGKKYVWQVQALDQYGFPPAQNQGKSEIFTFIKKSDQIIFPILILNFPLLQAPSNNSIISGKKPEFNWSYTPKQGENIKYGIKVCKINSGQSPQQAINNTPFYTALIGGEYNSFIPPLYLNFSENSSYVWRIDVINKYNNNVLKSSEVWKFTYKQSGGIIGEPGEINFPSWCFVSGQLNYKFSGRSLRSNWPLINKNIKLVVKYILKYASHSGMTYYNESPEGTIILPTGNIPGNPSDNDLVLATTTTDANGHFNFNFISKDSMTLVSNNYTFTNCTNGENCYTYSGKVFRVARLIVEDKYFTSPDNDIIIQPWESKNLGVLVAGIKSYTLRVTSVASQNEYFKGNQKTEGTLDKMVVYILRKSRPQNLPDNEGSPKPEVPETKFGYEVIAKDITNQNGFVEFKNLVLNLNPADKYYYYAESDENASHTYKSGLMSFKFDYTSGAGSNRYNFYNGKIEHIETPVQNNGLILNINEDHSTFNSQYNHPVVLRNFYATPLLPEVKGRIVRSDDTGIGIDGANVKLVKVGPISLEREQSSNADGYFSFKYLNVNYSQNPPYDIIGPLRLLWVTADGFKFRIFDVHGDGLGGALLWGQRLDLGNLELNPSAIVHGFIADEDGNGIEAKVKIGNSPEIDVKPKWIFHPFPQPPNLLPGEFEFPVAKLPNQQMFVLPTNNLASYIIDTTYINIDKNYKDLGTIKIYKKLHRVKIKVLNEIAGVPDNQWPIIQGAKVRIELAGDYLQATTDNSGFAEFKFSNDATVFKVIVESPDGSNFEKRVGTIGNLVSKYPQEYPFSLKKATFISGHVYVANDIPVKDADVWIDFGNPDKNIYAKTNNNGEYFLNHVPINKYVRIFASKNSVDSTIIGDSIHVFTGKLGLGITGKNLYLKIYNGMDITKILGFPVLLTNLKEENNTIKIDGIIKEFKSNEIFSVFDSITAKLNFHNVEIQPGNKLNSKGISYAELSNPPLVFDNPNLDLKLFSKFQSEAGDIQNKLQMNEYQPGIGTIKGKVFVDKSQFDTKGSLTDYPGLYLSLTNTTQNKMIVSTITADGNKPANLLKGFNVVDENGNGLNFKVNGFNANSDPDNSYINYDTVRLKTILHTDIKNANPPDIKLNIGDIVFHQNGIDPLVSDKEFSFNLDSWKLISSKWYFNKGYLTITEGTLKTGADIPVKSLSITPTNFQSPDFDFSSLLVSGVAPLTITGNVSFDHNDYSNYWYVAVSKKPGENYSAYFKDLPGMETNALMKISNFEINSKSTFVKLTPVAGQTVVLYKVGLLKLGGAGALLGYDTYLQIPGLTFNIPKVTQSTAVEYFKGSGGKIAFRMKPITINTDAGTGVYMQFGVDQQQQNSQVLDENGFRSRGVIGEDGKFELINWLFHSANNTEVLVETPQTPYTYSQNYQRLDIGGGNTTYLNKVTGGMKPADSDNWNYYHFEGFIEGTKGVGFKDNQNKLAFTVEGEIVANNQELGIKNVDTPFGNMQWFYDFENKRLRGSVNVNTNIKNQIFLNGAAETIVDGDGWYFFGGLNMGMASPHLEGVAGILFGNYPMTQEIKSTFSDYSEFYQESGNLPPNFPTSVSGFFFEGGVEIPVPIFPDFDFNFGLVSAHLTKYIGCDFRLGMEFSETNKYYAGADIFAKIHAGVGGSVIFACALLDATACAAVSLNGEYHSNGDWSADGYGGVTLKGTTTVGYGVCDADCNGIGNPFGDGDSCDEHSEDASIGIGIEGKYGTMGKWIHIQWGDGGPSICN